MATVPDFPRSFATFLTHGRTNNARIQIEATCQYFAYPEDTAGELVVLVASCKGEDTYGTGSLFLVPNYDFCAIFGDSEYQIIRSFVSANFSRSGVEAGSTADRFEQVLVDLKLDEAEVCEDNAAIVEATLANRPLVAETEIADADRGARAILQYPVRTMNVNSDPDIFQVDTGPILLPNFRVAPVPDIRRFELAFVAYNTLHAAEFIVHQPTEAAPGVMVPHYSEVRQFQARNTIYCL